MRSKITVVLIMLPAIFFTSTLAAVGNEASIAPGRDLVAPPGYFTSISSRTKPSGSSMKPTTSPPASIVFAG